MSKEPKGYQTDQVRAANEFALGEITLEKFLRFHPIGRGYKWKHMVFVRRQSFIWHQLIERLPVPFRLKAYLDSEDLSVPYLRENMQITSGNYINIKNYELMIEEGLQTTLLKLAVVLDIPIRYLRGFDTSELVVADFDEYDYLIMDNKQSFSEIVSWTLKRDICRIIEGFIVDNSEKEIPFVHKNHVYVRVDKNVNFFRFEIFLESRPYASVGQIKELLNAFQGSVKYVYKEESLLRKVPKLTFIGIYKNTSLELLEEYVNDLSESPGKERIYPF
ncbi:hypothetical protein LC048_07240 [Mesobacillus subterraneus]|uniref:hypothetical protein n=1 Tax=Mesobacillus subterraneus TaxID=285983 RepID=UPI001CFCFCE8|nr:hypothetical protein [Mesobacillus subterraneus]WLR56675.1 hypothetical protein LC048_07240 [Mesobacillus subterraneus]